LPRAGNCWQSRIARKSLRAGPRITSIAKASDGSVTRTSVALLDVEGRQQEIARMLSGAEITPEARAQAERLLEQA